MDMDTTTNARKSSCTRSRGTHVHTVLGWEKRKLTSHVPPFSHGDSAQSSISINHRSTMHHNTSMDWTGLNMAREDLSGIHTGGGGGGGGREMRDFPQIPLPPLNQHMYYNKVVLKHKQQQSDNCCSKKGMHLFKNI